MLRGSIVVMLRDGDQQTIQSPESCPSDEDRGESANGRDSQLVVVQNLLER